MVFDKPTEINRFLSDEEAIIEDNLNMRAKDLERDHGYRLSKDLKKSTTIDGEKYYCSVLSQVDRSDSTKIVMCTSLIEDPEPNYEDIDRHYAIGGSDWDKMVDSDRWGKLQVKQALLKNRMKAETWLDLVKGIGDMF